MGLAASQARFLGITLRKANLEFKSTELAQQKIELTDQMSLISQDYSNAINATKLTWVNEQCDADYGVTYSLLMTPSAANNYNPYMVTTKSGAIVLNSKFQAAAEAAGVSMAGGIPSDSGYKKFVKEMEAQGLITNTTEKILEKQTWHSTAGLGAIPKDKSSMDEMVLSDLISSSDFGEKTIDWLQIYRSALGYDFGDKSTDISNSDIIEAHNDRITKAKLQYSKANNPATSKNYGTAYVNEQVSTAQSQAASNSGIMGDFKRLEDKIAQEANTAKKLEFEQELEYLKMGLDSKGKPIGSSDNEKYENSLKYPLYWEIYDKYKYENSEAGSGGTISWDSNAQAKPTNGGSTIGFSQMFHTYNRYIAGGGSGGNENYTVYVPEENQSEMGSSTLTMCTITLFENDVMQNNQSAIKNMTIADLLKQNVVLMTQMKAYTEEQRKTAEKTLEIAGTGILDYIARVFGYDSIGTGLNVDESTDAALQQAYAMTKRKFLSAKGAVSSGNRGDDQNPLDNYAYINANSHNRIGVQEDDYDRYAALNISNMLSAFLTYYDNALRGAESEYVVGKSNDVSPDGGAKTYFVTDDPDYVYITNVEDAISENEKINDFYSELYNSICEHGWRYDGNLDDYEYLESTIKDGRYSLMALNPDGYYYQSKYNDIEYIVEEQDRDAIARAEADFTRKKAEITNKEDIIDIKTKKLDAEIAELTTEMNSVQNIISKSIEKTFALFSN